MGDNIKIKAKDRFLAKYRCRACRKEFSFDNTLGSAVKCPQCRSLGCIALTPTAMVFADSKVTATRETKIDKYKIRSAGMISRLDQLRQMLLSCAEVLELSKSMKTEIDSVLNKACKEAKQIIDDRLSRHSRDKAQA